MSDQQGWVHGPIDRTPCPHCGKGIDLRDARDQNLLDTGKFVECDFCRRWSEVCAVQTVTVVSLRRTNTAGSIAQASAVSRLQLKR